MTLLELMVRLQEGEQVVFANLRRTNALNVHIVKDKRSATRKYKLSSLLATPIGDEFLAGEINRALDALRKESQHGA